MVNYYWQAGIGFTLAVLVLFLVWRLCARAHFHSNFSANAEINGQLYTTRYVLSQPNFPVTGVVQSPSPPSLAQQPYPYAVSNSAYISEPGLVQPLK